MRARRRDLPMRRVPTGARRGKVCALRPVLLPMLRAALRRSVSRALARRQRRVHGVRDARRGANTTTTTASDSRAPRAAGPITSARSKARRVGIAKAACTRRTTTRITRARADIANAAGTAGSLARRAARRANRRTCSRACTAAASAPSGCCSVITTRPAVCADRVAGSICKTPWASSTKLMEKEIVRSATSREKRLFESRAATATRCARTVGATPRIRTRSASSRRISARCADDRTRRVHELTRADLIIR